MMTGLDYFKNSLDLWQAYMGAYTDLTVAAAQQTLKQSLAFRERMDEIVVKAIGEFQTLQAQEQEIAFSIAEMLVGQAQDTVDCSIKLLTTLWSDGQTTAQSGREPIVAPLPF